MNEVRLTFIMEVQYVPQTAAAPDVRKYWAHRRYIARCGQSLPFHQ